MGIAGRQSMFDYEFTIVIEGRHGVSRVRVGWMYVN